MSTADAQLMMTLAALAYIDETPLQGESLAEQESRILADLNGNATYGLPQSPAAAGWTAAWVGLSADPQRSNMAYVATSSSARNTYAVAIRGSDFHLFLDALEDFDIRETVTFGPGGTIATGANDGFHLVTEAVGAAPGPLAGTAMVQALQRLVAGAGEGQPITIYVTGHSLGGALASVVALYLRSLEWSSSVVFQVYTFAAPTAGDAAFATAFDKAFPGTAPGTDSSWRVFNAFDVVPHAWESLSTVKSFYPTPPGPVATLAVKLLLDGIEAYAGGNQYVQPNPAGSPGALQLNGDYDVHDPANTAPTFGAFMGQLGFQHGCNTYLQLLGAPQVTFQPGT
ncbi:MAG TPA: lipase family protein [Candidatus Binatia bacterium]|nr:lipase family protein [Candidatus Binatia bacterium]